MIRRPGNPKFSSAETNAGIDSFYSFHLANTTIQVIADSTTDVEVLTQSSETSIWTKTTGAGEGYFQGVNNSLYVSDGSDTFKYIPGTTNASNQFAQGAGKSIWLFSPVAPLFAPTLTVTSTGSSGVAWAASSFFSTMGFIIDSNNDIQQLISVNALANNATQYGVSGKGQPAWSSIAGSPTTDGGVTWQNNGQITLWQASTSYLSGQPIYDPITNTIQVQCRNTTRTSGTTAPKFSSVLFTQVQDTHSGGGNAVWECLGIVNGTPTAVKTWAPSTLFTAYTFPSGGQTNATNCAIVEPGIPTAAALNAGQIFYLQVAKNTGTTAASYTNPTWSLPGQTTTDNQLIWYNLGPSAWAPNTTYTAWPGVNNQFSAVIDTNGTAINFWVCIVGGLSSGSIPFPTTGSNPPAYGTTAIESTGVTWVCVGPSQYSVWVANSDYYLPAVGFSPPTPTNPYGGAVVFDNEGPAHVQFTIQSGFSGGSQPSWTGTKGSDTTDHQVIWIDGGTFGGLGFSWTKGYGYVFAYKSRAANDPDVTTAPPLAQVIANNPNVMGPLGPPTGAQDGSVSTASPVGFFGSPTASPNAGANITIQGKYSLDPAIDTIMIFRSTDGFQTSGPYLLVTEIPNITALATDPTNPLTGLFSVVDFMADTPSVVGGVTLPGLNELIEAPIDHANDPIPGQFGSTQFMQLVGSLSPNPLNPFSSTAIGSALQGLTYHQGRLWGFIGSNVFASGGPDTIVGNGFTAWPPANVFPFNSNVTRILSTTSGLLVFTTTGLELIGGGPAISTYYSQLLVDGLGLLSWNALTLMAGIPYVFAADRQLLGIEPGTGIIRAGHPIGDLLQQFDPTKVYLTYHSYGDLDHALFIGDGIGTWYRCDTNLAPDSQLVGPVWSPAATITGGFKALSSIETAPGLKQLLIGPSSAGFVLARDSTFTVFSDGGPAGITGGSVTPIFLNSSGASWQLVIVGNAPSSTLNIVPVTYNPAYPSSVIIQSPNNSYWAISIAGDDLVTTSVLSGPATVIVLQDTSGQLWEVTIDNTGEYLDITEINGTPYESFFTIGAIVLANPGQMAKLGFLEFDLPRVGTQANVSVLFDELVTPATEGDFESISNDYITDPPKLYGPNNGGGTQPVSVYMPRFYFGQTTPENFGQEEPLPAWCKFLNIKVDFGDTDTVQNEVLSFTIYGSLFQES